MPTRTTLAMAMLGAAVLATPVRARAEASIDVGANRTEIYIGESVLLTVTVQGSQDAAAPDLSAMTNCTAQVRNRMTQMFFNNGILTRSVVFTVEVVPAQPGDFQAGPIQLDVDGHTLRATGPTVRVRGVEPQDWVYLKANASRDSVIVDESFEVELEVGIKQLREPYSGHDPLTPQSPPHLSVPFLGGTPDGLEGPDLHAILQASVVSAPDQPGFAVNDYTVNVDPFANFFNSGMPGMPMDQRVARFMFPKRAVYGPQGMYMVYSLRLRYTARKEGNYTFGPVEFKGAPITDVGPGGQVTTRSVFAVGPAATVRVVPPPEEGRPPVFIGAVGSNMVVTASLDAQTCNVGDPLTLTLDIGGSVNLENLTPPVLSQQKALTEHFRVYDDTVHTATRPGGRTYRYTIRPTQAGTLELPPIEVAYYDSGMRAYRTIRTAPIPLRANATAEVAGGIILSDATNASGRIDFSASDRDTAQPAAMTLDPAGAVPTAWANWRVHGVVAGAGPAVLALTLIARGSRRLLRRRQAVGRPRRARHAAGGALRQAENETDPVRRTAAVRAAMAAFLGDTFHVAAQGLTPSDVRALLAGQPELPPDVATRTGDVYERLFQAQFAQSAAGVADAAVIGEVRELLGAIESTVRAAARTRRRRPISEESPS